MQSAPSSSGDYAKRLSRGQFRGTLNLIPELDAPLLIERKAKLLAEQIKKANYVVLHTGAGISVACGINDFRGPNGIWTSEAKKLPRKRRRPDSFLDSDDDGDLENIEGDTFEYADGDHLEGAIEWDEPPKKKASSIENAAPSLTHMVISEMVKRGQVKMIISQNVDNLHLKSGVPREKLSEIHGNLFMEWCKTCEVEYMRDFELQSAGLKATGRICTKCGGDLTDKQLDWENELPVKDERVAEEARIVGDLHIVVGSSCQMLPSRDYPFKSGHRYMSCIINLSRTNKDSSAGSVIRARCDTVFALLADYLGIKVPNWNHTSEITLYARPKDAESLFFGVHTENGADDEKISLRIPWVKSISYFLDGAVFEPGGGGSRKSCTTNASLVVFKKSAVVRAEIRLWDDKTVDLELNYDGERISCAKTINVRSVSYDAVGENEMKLVKSKASDALINWNHFKRDLKSWIVYNKKGRYVDCMFCGKGLYVGGGPWQRAASKHLSGCLEAIVGPNPALAN